MRSTLHDPLLTAENRLWRAVLEQAYADAESRFDSVSDDADDDDGHDGPPERLRARHYLRGDSKQEAANLVLVCSFAEIPADRVLNWARRNYPSPHSQLQKSLAMDVVGARHNRAHSCSQVSA
ncbi:MAG TPA: hypothetical protein VGJ06_00220 [Candidatus Acidoferrum sp.]|jgi:hypothetical protein